MEKNIVLVFLFLSTLLLNNSFSEESVGCPHAVGKGKIKIRTKIAYIEAEKCYSDEIWKSFRVNSVYTKDYDKMVDLPSGWHLKKTKSILGIEYGISDRLSMGLATSYITKNLKRQIWSKKGGKTVWQNVDDTGIEGLWFSAKYLLYSNPNGLFGFDYKDGLFIAFGYKPSISSDKKIKNGIGSGSDDFKFVILSHPHFTENFFLCSDIWCHYRGEVKEIENFSKSGIDLGDRFGYRFIFGYEFPNHKIVLAGGPQGWISGKNKKDGNIEDSNTHSHGFLIKVRWQPFGDEDAGSIDCGIRLPIKEKLPFSSNYMIALSGRIKF